jgi:hypothetical protein
VLDASEVLRKDSILIDDINTDVVARYRKVLEQLDEPLPKPFVLQDIIDATTVAAPPPPPPAQE